MEHERIEMCSAYNEKRGDQRQHTKPLAQVSTNASKVSIQTEDGTTYVLSAYVRS